MSAWPEDGDGTVWAVAITRGPLVELVDGSVDLIVPQGRSLRFSVDWNDGAGAPITVIDARAQVRASYEAALPALDLTSYLNWSTPGQIEVNVPAAITESLVDWGVGVWDLEAVDNNQNVEQLLGGTAVLDLQVTRGEPAATLIDGGEFPWWDYESNLDGGISVPDYGGTDPLDFGGP